MSKAALVSVLVQDEQEEWKPAQADERVAKDVDPEEPSEHLG